jgi:hypothetical protein
MRTYTKREIAHLLRVSPRTVADDAKFLNLSPQVGDRMENRYSQSDYNLICQLRKHCADKTNTRDSFVPSTEVEIVSDDQLTVHRMEAAPTAIDIYQESLELGLSQDPLFDLELLQRISDRHYLMPAQRLAPILGLKPSTLLKKKTHCHCGFICTKEAIVGGKMLWKVSSNRS